MAIPMRDATHPDPTSDEGTLSLIRSRFEHSESAFSSYRTKVKRWYDLYRGRFTGRQHQKWRNDIHLPLVFSTIEGDVARKLSTLYGEWPYVRHFGFGAEDEMSARKNDLLISVQLKDCNSYKKSSDFMKSADIYGSGISITSWLYEEEELIVREMRQAPITQQMLEHARTQAVATFNGPNFEVVDILDAFPQPGVHDIEDMDWFIIREWFDLDDVMAFEKMGIFDRGTARQIEFNHRIASMRREIDEKYTYRTTSFDSGNTPQQETYAKPVEIWEMWGRVPSEFVPEDGGTQRVITVANGQVVCRNRPNPYYHGRIPVHHYSPMRDPHDFFGAGKAEVAEKMQIAANRLACQKLDALDLFIDPLFYANRAAGIDNRRLYTRPGGVIYGDLPPGEAIERLLPDMSGIQNAYQEIQFLWSQIQQASSIIDPVLGVAGPDRETATSFRGRLQNVSVRLGYETRMCEEMWLEPVCKTFRALDYQFLDFPHERRILGSNAVTDLVTGQPVEREQLQVVAEDLFNDYDVRAMGSTQILSKFEKQQNMVNLLSTVGSHPAGVGLINWLAFFREMFLTFDLRNVDELLQPPPQQQEAMAQTAALGIGGGQGGIPSATGGARGASNAVTDVIGTLGG